jgi:hypothetical protein
MDKTAPRLRLAEDIDLSRAKPGCNRCHGTGRAGSRIIDNPEVDGERISVPVICRCVTRGGGVKKDQLDRLAAEIAEQLEDGTFAKTLANDIMGLPVENRLSAINQLEADAINKEKSAKSRVAINAALVRIKELMKEEAHGDA